MSNQDITQKEMDIRTSFVNKLNELMTQNEIKNDAQVYENTSISQSRFSQLRNKQTTPKATELIEIANFFNVSIDTLINGSTNSTNENRIAWQEWTAADVIILLIDMYDAGIIDFKRSAVYLDYELYESDEKGVFIKDNYIQKKIEEWENVSAPFIKKTHAYDETTLTMLKKGFINDLSTKPFYKPIDDFMNIPIEDEDLPFN